LKSQNEPKVDKKRCVHLEAFVWLLQHGDKFSKVSLPFTRKCSGVSATSAYDSGGEHSLFLLIRFEILTKTLFLNVL